MDENNDEHDEKRTDKHKRQQSAHTALAVKACLLGCKTATLNAQVTFVNIGVAISALAGGDQERFRTEPGIGWCLRDFWTILACRRSRRYVDGILDRFGRLPASEKRTKIKKKLQIPMFSKDLG